MTAALLKIGEIAKQVGVAVGTIRYYETLQLIQPSTRGENGYRYYTHQTIQHLQFIRQAQTLGFSLEEIRQILTVYAEGTPPCGLVQTLLNQKIEALEEKLQQIQTFKAQLESYRDRWQQTPQPQTLAESEICPLIATIPQT
ncbi:heavy metal-responsive transcriptional regulator [Synechococcus elongatus]|uniref:Heavy metal-responsive transcriptional regulator n=1 Tax=Synechococcus elongatus PCC 11801 TaxID=2219813 RepID=A0AAN1QPH8_SYNEL|nr:heavy metal-responsive transcriptional regulator [Synechococcus elongatus]AZB73125.1 heavy metal-responsive transcriptional regulator [Synechococcus elongatus PCC 11801]